MRNKRLLTLVGSICLVLVLAALPFMAACPAPAPPEEVTPPPAEEEEAPSPPAPAEPRVLKMVSMLGPDFVMTQQKNFWIREVEYISNGQLIIDYLGSSEVIPVPEQIDAVSRGVIDVNWNCGETMGHVSPIGYVTSFTGMTPKEERETGILDFYREVFADETNTYMLGTTYAPMWEVLGSNVPCKNWAEANKIKFRSDARELPGFDAVGCTGVFIETMDLYTALERGVVDAFSWPPFGWQQFGWVEQIKYVIGPRLLEGHNSFALVNLDTWNSLSAQEQRWLEQPFIDNDELWYTWGYWTMVGPVWGEESIKAAGVEFISWPEEDSKKFKQLFEEAVWSNAIAKVKPDYAQRFAELIGMPYP